MATEDDFTPDPVARLATEDDFTPDAPGDDFTPDKPNLIDNTLKNLTAFGGELASAGLGLAEGAFRMPSDIGRVANIIQKKTGTQAVPDPWDPQTGVLTKGIKVGQFEIPGSSDIADQIHVANKLLRTKSSVFSQNDELMKQADEGLKEITDYVQSKGQTRPPVKLLDAVFNPRALLADEAINLGKLTAEAVKSGKGKKLLEVAKNPQAWFASAGSAGPALLASYASGGSLGVMALMEGFEYSNDAAEFEQRTGMPISDEEHTLGKLQTMIINGVLEKAGLDSIIKPLKAGTSKLLVPILKGGIGAVGEGGTEVLQQINSNLAKKLTIDEKQSLLEGAAGSFMGGMAAGGGMGGLQAFVGHIQEKAKQTPSGAQETPSMDIPLSESAKSANDLVTFEKGLLGAVAKGEAQATPGQLKHLFTAYPQDALAAGFDQETIQAVLQDESITADQVAEEAGTVKEFYEERRPKAPEAPTEAPAEQPETDQATPEAYGEANKDRILQEYEAQYGNVISNDSMKKFFAPAGYTGLDSGPFQGPAGKITKAYFDKKIKEFNEPGKQTVFMTGGTGSGKSSFVSQAKTDPNKLIFDLNLTSFERNKQLIQEAVDNSGNAEKPKITYVLRDPHKAYMEGVVGRAINPQSPDYGRSVPVKEHYLIHRQALQTFKKLADHFGDKIELEIIDNRGAENEAQNIGLEELAGVKYNYKELENDTKTEVQSSRDIPQDLKEALLSGSEQGLVQDQSTADQSKSEGSGRQNLEETRPASGSQQKAVASDPLQLYMVYRGKAVPVSNPQDAGAKWKQVVFSAMKQGLGNRSLDSDPVIQRADGRVLGIISWNGSFISQPNAPKAPPVQASQIQQIESDADLFQEAPAFFSALQRSIELKMPSKASPDQVRGILKSSGVKQEEIDWLDIEGFLKGKEKVEKSALIDFIQANNVQIQEVEKKQSDGLTPEEEGRLNVLDSMNSMGRLTDEQAKEMHNLASKRGTGNTKFQQYQLPGGENYREILLTLPTKKSVPLRESYQLFENGVLVSQGTKNASDRWLRDNPLADIRRADFPDNQIAEKMGVFQSTHFSEPNILVHIRANDRQTELGKTLFLEEVQSDWMQTGRKKGFKNTQRYEELNNIYRGGRASQEEIDEMNRLNAAEVGGVPDAPFKKTWHELALKRMLRYATENGYDAIAWTTGEQQAERYDLSQQIDELLYSPTTDSDGNVSDYTLKMFKNGEQLGEDVTVLPEKLEDTVGKEVAKRIREGEGEQNWKWKAANGPVWGGKVLKDSGLKVGGEGMKGFYDQIIPSFLNKYTKKWGGRVQTTKISTGLEKQTKAGGLTTEQKKDLRALAKEVREKNYKDFNEDFNAITGIDITEEQYETLADLMRDPYSRTTAVAEFVDGTNQLLKDTPKGQLEVHSLTITPAMQESIMGGQSLFQAQQAQIESPEFKKWFGESKVVDESGKPLVVYHGTKAKSEEGFAFDYGKIQGRNEGAGFYFTDSQQIARGYGNDGAVISAYLSIEKPMPYDHPAFKPPVLKKLIKRVAEIEADNSDLTIQDGFLSNFGDIRSEGMGVVLSKASDNLAPENTALDQISGMVGAGVSAEVVNQAVQEVTGFDGIVADGFSNLGAGQQGEKQKIYVAFFPEQVKSVNNRGTFDPKNPNILFQANMAKAQASTFEEEARKVNLLLERHGIERTVQLAAEILTPSGGKAFGVYRPKTKMIEIISQPMKTTGFHEAFHVIEEEVLKVGNHSKKELYDEVKRLTGKETDRDAREELADAFAEYANKREGSWSDKLIAFFEDVLHFLRGMVGQADPRHTLFDAILNPKNPYKVSITSDGDSLFQEMSDKEAVAYKIAQGQKPTPEEMTAFPELAKIYEDYKGLFTQIKLAKYTGQPLSDVMQSQLREASKKLGFQPSTQATKNEIGDPQEAAKNAEEDKKLRGFIETVKESKRTPLKIQDTVSETQKAFYSVVPNAQTILEADNLIKTDPNKALSMAKNGKIDKTNFAVAVRLIHAANAGGQYEQAIDIIESLSARATQAGQAVQILSLYNKLTPDGIVFYAQRLAVKGNQDLQAKGKEPRYSVPPELAIELKAMATKVQAMKEGREKTIETAKLMKMAASVVPPSILAKISTFQTIMQLLNMKTLLRNLIGNGGFFMLENISDSVGAVLDMVVGIKTNERTQLMPNYGTQLKGAQVGFIEGVQDAVAGVDTSQTNTKFDFQPTTMFTDPILGSLEKGLSIALRAPDRAFYQAAFNQELNNQLRAAGKTAPTMDMLDRARYEGLRRTFQDDNVMSRIFTGFKKILNARKEWGLGDLVIKYPKTPANILMRGIEYSPFNFVNTVATLAGPAFGQRFDQRKFVQSTSRALVGSSLLVGTGFILASLGILRGRPDRDRDVESMMKEIGIGNYTINVSALSRFFASGLNQDFAEPQEGDITASYDWFQPQAIGLAIGANLYHNPEGHQAMEDMADVISSGVTTLIDQPLMQGIRGLTQGYDSQSMMDNVFKILEGVPASFVPTLLNQVKQLQDNTARNTGSVNYFDRMYKRAAYRIPWASQTLEPRITIWGDNQEVYQDGSNNPFNVLINPAFINRYKPSSEAKMVLDIWQSTGIKTHFPRVADRKQVVNGERVELTPESYTQFQRYIGHKTGVLYSALSENKQFMALPDEAKAKMLSNSLTDISTSGKILILGHRPKRASRKVKALVAGGV